MSELSASTRAIRAGIDTDPSYGSVVPPLYLSSNFAFEDFAQPGKYEYTRSGNPTRDVFADAVTTLEGGVGGIVTSTGMAGVLLIVQAFVRPGQTIVVPHDCYGGSWRLFDTLAEQGLLNYVTVDFNDADAVDAALANNPRMVWLESPSNPLLRITDLEAITAKAHRVGALVVADNTFMSPVLQRPLALGADIVVHSATKYINGHSDVVSGVVIAKTTELLDRLDWYANIIGVTGSPFDSYLALRGLRTLKARMGVHCSNAAAVADALREAPGVQQVYYPGLTDHPGHKIAARQQEDFGAMVSVELAGGVEAVKAFVTGLQCVSLAESLGGIESLVAHPTTMTHASMTPEAREQAGIRDGLLRLSIGIEETGDLVTDLIAACTRAAQATKV